jgi:hypothetical protein
MGFEPPSRTIHSITRQRQCDHDYCAPAFSQVNLLLNTVVNRLLVLDILKTEKSRVRDRFISYSKYSRRGTLFIQKKVGSALTETENWDVLVDCTSRDGRQMLDAGVKKKISPFIRKRI